VIGRFCYWDDDDEFPWDPEPEHDRVTTARHELIARLDSAAALIPGDPWVVGQRIRYTTEAAQFANAEAALGNCRAESWWCTALSGYVAHVTGDFRLADSLFAVSLAIMPEEQQCEWSNLELLLDGAAARHYHTARCEERAALNVRIFWLADPLFLTPGNERRTEHFARRVVNTMLEHAENPHGMRWGDDYAEVTMRFGWATGWKRSWDDAGAHQPSIIGFRREGGRQFIPQHGLSLDPSAIGMDEWELDPELATERYAPAYATDFFALEPQVALFPRRDGMKVVCAFSPPVNAEFDERSGVGDNASSAEVALILTTHAHGSPAVVRETIVSGAARLAVLAPTLPALLSVETLNRSDSIAARYRRWLRRTPPEPRTFALSDILLLDPGEPLPSTLEGAVRRARPSNTFGAGEEIALYWETLGGDGEGTRAVTLTVVKQGRGFLRRAAEWLGLASRDTPTVRLEWDDPVVRRGEVRGSSVTLQIPENQDGRFRIRLDVVTAAGSNAHAEREIVVVRD
jgi:hypothetical protein